MQRMNFDNIDLQLTTASKQSPQLVENNLDILVEFLSAFHLATILFSIIKEQSNIPDQL